jgi:Ca2+-binding EF-hand superfamily protein
MLRTYVRWGIPVEDKFAQSDPKNSGNLPKKTFINILKRIELPFRQKELNDIANHYFDPSTDKIDYISFLKNANLQSDLQRRMLLSDSPTKSQQTSGQVSSAVYTKNVLREVKDMLLQSLRSLNKNFDDFYRMFARWDTDVSGTVTSTQFLRVLNRLHVEMSDSDQDFLVELLDTQGMGRIDFESLLTYCLMSGDTAPATSVNSPPTITTAMTPAKNETTLTADYLNSHDDDAGAETVSAMSADGNTSLDMKSSGTPAGHNFKRPWTATTPNDRTLHQFLNNSNHGVNTLYGNLSHSFNRNLPSTSSNSQLELLADSRGVPPLLSDFDRTSANVYSPQSHLLRKDPFPDNVIPDNNTMNSSNRLLVSSTGQRLRPLTASARVSSSQTVQYNAVKLKRQQEFEEPLIEDLPDDVIHGEEQYLLDQGKLPISANNAMEAPVTTLVAAKASFDPKRTGRFAALNIRH